MAFLYDAVESRSCIDGDYMAYKIEIPNLAQATELKSIDSLVDLTPYYSSTVKDMVYVPMKYYLGDVIGLHKASPDVYCKRHCVSCQCNLISKLVCIIDTFI